MSKHLLYLSQEAKQAILAGHADTQRALTLQQHRGMSVAGALVGAAGGLSIGLALVVTHAMPMASLMEFLLMMAAFAAGGAVVGVAVAIAVRQPQSTVHCHDNVQLGVALLKNEHPVLGRDARPSPPRPPLPERALARPAAEAQQALQKFFPKR
jgi:hypothetical protein